MTPARRLRALAYAVARVALAGGLMAYLVVEVVRQWDAIRSQLSRPSLSWLALSTLALVVHYLLINENWRVILRRLGAPVSWRRAFRIVFLSNMAKYLPGGLWNLVGRVALCRVVGISGTTSSVSLMLELVAGISAMALVTLAATFVMPADALPVSRALIAAVVAMMVVSAHPTIVNGMLGLVGRLFRRRIDPLPFRLPFVIRMIGQYVVAWLILGASFVWLAMGILPGVTAGDTALLSAAIIASWLIGLLAFLVPGGLGVREVVFVAIVAGRFDDGVGAALAVASRIQILAAEGLGFLLALLVTDPEASAQPGGGHDEGEADGGPDRVFDVAKPAAEGPPEDP